MGTWGILMHAERRTRLGAEALAIHLIRRIAASISLREDSRSATGHPILTFCGGQIFGITRYNWKARKIGLPAPKRHQLKHLDCELPLVRDQGSEVQILSPRPTNPTESMN